MAGFWLVPPPVPLVEPIAAQEIMVNGPGGIYYENGMLVIPLYREETPVETPGANPQRVVKVKIIRPVGNVTEAIDMLAHVLWPSPPMQPEPHPRGFHLHPVR